jgi:flagellar motor protein MotB
MADNIIQLASQYLTPDMIAKLAGMLGESNTSTASLVSAASPMLLSGMACGNAPGRLDMVTKAMASTGAASPSVLDGFAGKMAALASGGAGSNSLVETGSSLLGGMFGDKTSLMTKALSAFSGAKPGSASTVLSLLTPLLVGVMGKSLAGSGQAATPAAVTALLGSNKTAINDALPPELKRIIAGIPGLGALLCLPTVAAAAPVAAVPVAAAAANAGFGRFVPWILGALALGLLAWWLFGRNTVDVATCNAQFKTALVGKTINFDSGDAVIAADSKALLGELAEVANRCQAFKIEIGGHTDTVGDPAMNKTLSQSRADAVRAYLVGKGVPAGQLTAIGYGAERPAVATGNEVAMAANRRIEFTVSQ